MDVASLPLSPSTHQRLAQCQADQPQVLADLSADVLAIKDDLAKARKANPISYDVAMLEDELHQTQEELENATAHGWATTFGELLTKDIQKLNKRFTKLMINMIKQLPSIPNAALEEALRQYSEQWSALADQSAGLHETLKSSLSKNSGHFGDKNLMLLCQHEDVLLVEPLITQWEHTIASLSAAWSNPATQLSANPDYPQADARTRYAKQLYGTVKAYLNDIAKAKPHVDMEELVAEFSDASNAAELAALILEGDPLSITRHYVGIEKEMENKLSQQAKVFLTRTIHNTNVYDRVPSSAPSKFKR